MPMQPAGTKNHLVTIQSKTSGQDSNGQPLVTWTDVATVWANVRAPTGLGSITAERIAGTAEVSPTLYSIRIGYRTTVDAGMRALDGSKVYEVRQVIHDEADLGYTDLVCATGASQG